MRIDELFNVDNNTLLYEEAVASSWIDDIEMDDSDLMLTLHSGSVYRIHKFPTRLFDKWLVAPSPGKFWHRHVARRFIVTREF